jgi:hypothetical protein
MEADSEKYFSFFKKPCKKGEPFALWLMMSANSLADDATVTFVGGLNGHKRFPGNWNRVW